MARGSHDTPEAETDEVRLHGGRDDLRPDQARRGRGGEDDVEAAALNLASNNDDISLDRDSMNNFARSQVHRIRTAANRRTRDDRRATPNPMELSFLASGRGHRAERRPPSRNDPARGHDVERSSRAEGAAVGGSAVGELALQPLGAELLGATAARAGAGVAFAAPAPRSRRSALVQLARPDVPRARAAVPSNQRGRPNDTADSNQEVSSAVAALIHASTAGGRVGAGRGGSTGPGARGSGGVSGPGSRSRSAGNGGERESSLDPRLFSYLRGVKRKVDPLWEDAFPEWAIAEGRGGLAVVALTILADGRVRSVKVARPSGLSEFDRKVVAAVHEAAPFGPIPKTVGRRQLAITIAFDARNPVVGSSRR